VRLYAEAGADLVTTDTFGGTSFRLRLHGLDGQRDRINRQAVETVSGRSGAGRWCRRPGPMSLHRDDGRTHRGSTCGTGIADMVEIARRMVRATRLPALIQPNAGLPETRDGNVVYTETPETFAARVPGLLELGVAIVVGCCGSTPDHTRALRSAVDAWSSRTQRGPI
jgi:5-methyltetrahydrofolate--homocysteine methyltransferase